MSAEVAVPTPAPGSRPRPDSPVLCGAPFVAMEFDPFGNVQACCSNAIYPLGNVARQTLRDIWSGARATTLRDAMIDRDFSKGCIVCRHRLTFPDGEVPRDYYDYYAVDSLTPEWPQLLNFSLHNTCNLECIMCGADLSSKIRAKRTNLPPLPHVYPDRFFDEIRPFLEHCSGIDMAGGEPFLVREHREIWRVLHDVARPPIISITTNGTVWNDYVESVLDAFDTNICVSVDGVTPETFETVRQGASFAVVMENLERFRTYAAARGTHVFLSFSMVRQNWFELGAVLRFADERGIEVSVQTVIEPEFGVQRLPTPELELVVRALEAEGVELAPALTINRAAWDRQVLRLRTELHERAHGITRPPMMEPPAPGHATHVTNTILAIEAETPPAAVELARARREMAKWAEGGPVVEIELASTGRISRGDLAPILPAQGGTDAAAGGVGTGFAEVLDQIALALDASLWIGEEIVEPGRVIHTLWFGRGHEARHKEGLVVRLVSVASGSGGAIVVAAADRTLLPSPPRAATPVAIGSRTT